MAENHIFFTVVQVTRTNFAIRYTPKPVEAEGGKLQFSMAFDMLVSGESLANKETALQQVADILNKEAYQL